MLYLITTKEAIVNTLPHNDAAVAPPTNQFLLLLKLRSGWTESEVVDLLADWIDVNASQLTRVYNYAGWITNENSTLTHPQVRAWMSALCVVEDGELKWAPGVEACFSRYRMDPYPGEFVEMFLAANGNDHDRALTQLRAEIKECQ